MVEGFYYNEVVVVKTKDGIEKVIVPKYSPPNMGAVAFWLKCKLRDGDPDDEEDTGWRDYKAVEIGNLDDGKPFNINVTID